MVRKSVINLLVAVRQTEVTAARTRRAAIDRVLSDPGTDAIRVGDIFDKQHDDVARLWASPAKSGSPRTLLSIYVDDVDDIKSTIVDLGAKAEIMGAWDVYTGEIVYPVHSSLYTFQRDQVQFDDKGVSTLIKSAKSNADLDQIVLLGGQVHRKYA